MSIDGRGPSLARSAHDTISALKSKNERQAERIAVLEGIAQANADDRDSYAERCVEIEEERDRARSIAIKFEQQLDAVRAGLVAAAGEVRSFPERGTSEWVQGQYTELLDRLAAVLEITGEHYPNREPVDAAEELARRWETNEAAHAGQMLLEALDLDDEAREQDRLDQLSSIAGWTA